MGKYARTEGMGSGILHQVCQVSKIHEVGLELLWRNLPFMSVPLYVRTKIKDYIEKSLIPIFTKIPPNTSCSKEYFRIIFFWFAHIYHIFDDFDCQVLI